jgi:hypothetical protein
MDWNLVPFLSVRKVSAWNSGSTAMDDLVELDGNALTMSRGNGKGKIRLLTRDLLDGRTQACKQFDSIARGIAQDIGGEDQLSTVQKHLVEAFAGIALQVNDCNARLLLGERVDIIEHSTAVITLVRVATRLGVKRVAHDITAMRPTAEDYFRFKAAAKALVIDE